MTPGSAPGSSETGTRVDVASDAFAGRLSTLLREHRRADGVRLRTMARRSGGRFSTRDLREIESGRSAVDDAVELAALYGADLSSILPARMAVEVDPGGRVITAGVAEEFEPDDVTSLLTAYLRLIRRLRNDERAPVVALRRDDVEALAAVLDEPGERVLDRLGELMSATQAQRKLMVGLFVSGAVVVGLAVTAVAATSGDPADPVPAVPPGSAVSEETAETEVEAPASEVDAAEVDEAEVGEADVREAQSDGSEVVAPEAEVDAVEGVFIAEPWSGPVAPAAGLDVSPLPPIVDVPAPAPAPVPAPAPTPAPVPPTTAPVDVAVGEAPVPVTTAPVVEPTPPASDEPVADDPEPTVAVAPPPVPSTTAPIPDP